MPWLRVGDTAASHPVVLRALELPQADERLKMELFGFAALAASMSASHKSDYIVELGTIRAIAGFTRAEELIKAAIACGYFEEISKDGNTAYKLLDDPELFHMRLKEEIDWENRRKNDNRNPALTVPVRLRDGDACRWCGRVVYWKDRKSARGATYDHLHPSKGAETPADMVVACKSCNSSRKDNKDWSGTLLPAPVKPYYGAITVEFLKDNDIDVPLSSESEKPKVTGKEAAKALGLQARPAASTEKANQKLLHKESVPRPVAAGGIKVCQTEEDNTASPVDRSERGYGSFASEVSLNGDSGFSEAAMIAAFEADLVEQGEAGASSLVSADSVEKDNHAWHPANWDSPPSSVEGSQMGLVDLESVPRPVAAGGIKVCQVDKHLEGETQKDSRIKESAPRPVAAGGIKVCLDGVDSEGGLQLPNDGMAVPVRRGKRHRRRKSFVASAEGSQMGLVDLESAPRPVAAGGIKVCQVDKRLEGETQKDSRIKESAPRPVAAGGIKVCLDGVDSEGGLQLPNDGMAVPARRGKRHRRRKKG